MTIIDEQGRIFGVVNVIDAITVTLLGLIVVAGAIAVMQPDPSPEPTTVSSVNVTFDIGDPPDFVVSAIEPGDTFRPDSSSTATITDVFVSYNNGKTDVVLRVELMGPVREGSVIFAGAPARLGRELEFETDRYTVPGEIRAVGGDTTFATSTQRLLLKAHLAPPMSESFRAGTELTVGGRSVISVESVKRYDRGQSDGAVAYIIANVTTLETADGPLFGGRIVQPGATVGIPVRPTPISANVVSTNPEADMGTTDVLVSAVVSANTARDMTVGDSYVVNGEEIGTVESLAVYGTNTNDVKRVFVGLRLATVDVEPTPKFGTTPVQNGASIHFETKTYDFVGTVERVGATTQPGSEAVRTVTLKLTDVSPTLAASIEAGMSETGGESTVAQIVNVEREPATVVLTSEDGNIYQRDHPVKKDVTLRVELTVRETSSGVTFKGRTVKQGSQIVLDLDGLVIEGRIQSL